MRILAALLVFGAVVAVAPASAQDQAGQPAQVPGDAAGAPMESVPVATRSTGAVDGLWCGSGPLHEFSLKLTQRQQDVEGELVRRGKARTIEGRIEGNVLRTQATKVGALVLERRGEELKVTSGDGPIALARGQVFRRSGSGTCSG